MPTPEFWQRERDELARLIRLTLIATAGDAVDIVAQVDPAESQAEIINWMNDYAPKLAGQITDNTRSAIDQALEGGLPLDEVFKKILSDSRAELIAVTEVTRSLAKGVQLAARMVDPKKQRVQWHTANDELVCEEWCAPLNGEIRNKGQSFGVNVWGEIAYGPPMHPGDRCWTTPYVG